jgi:hypothetical protein
VPFFPGLRNLLGLSGSSFGEQLGGKLTHNDQDRPCASDFEPLVSSTAFLVDFRMALSGRQEVKGRIRELRAKIACVRTYQEPC